MRDDADDLGVLLDALELGVDFLRCLSELFGVPGERLLLRRVPVLVEPVQKEQTNINKPYQCKNENRNQVRERDNRTQTSERGTGKTLKNDKCSEGTQALSKRSTRKSTK